MRRKLLKKLITGILYFFGIAQINSAIGAEKLPSDDDVAGIFKLCALGRRQVFEGDVRGQLNLWRRGAEATGKASIDDLGALLGVIKPDPSSVELYRLYTNCIKENIKQYIDSRSSSIDPDTVIRIVDIRRNRSYLEERLGAPAYISTNWLPAGALEVGYSWEKIYLQIIYFENQSVQYTITVRDNSYKPLIEGNRNFRNLPISCLGCAPIIRYNGEPASADYSTKFFYYVELLADSTTATGFRSLYIGHTSNGAKFGTVDYPVAKCSAVGVSDAVSKKVIGRALRGDWEEINKCRSELYPNTYSVRSESNTPKGFFDSIILAQGYDSIIRMPD